MSTKHRANIPSISLKTPGPAHARSEGLEYAVAVIGKYIDRGTIYVPALDKEAAAAESLFTPIFQKRGYASNTPLELVGYEIAPVTAQELKERFLSSRRAARVIRGKLCLNLLRGFPMSQAASAFASAVVGGSVKAPKPEKKKPSLRHRDTLLSAIASKVSRGFSVPLGAAKTKYYEMSSPPICGVTVAAAAFRGFGPHIAWERADVVVRKYLKEAENLEESGVLFPAKFRTPCNALWAYSEPVYFADAKEFSESLTKAREVLGAPEPLPYFNACNDGRK